MKGNRFCKKQEAPSDKCLEKLHISQVLDGEDAFFDIF